VIQYYQFAYEDCYPKVSGNSIYEKEYKRAQHIWNDFQLKQWVNTMICILDVLLLADVMNKLRQTCTEHKVDPSHFYTLPNCSWNVMLKMTNVNIELMRDVDMYNMITKTFRGGLCTTGSIRHAKANNPYERTI